VFFGEQVVADGGGVVGFVAGDDRAVFDGEILWRAVFAGVAFPAVEVFAVPEGDGLFAGREFD
jgi:hypothetical protein